MSTFSNRLRGLRKEKQLTGEELGKVFNVTKTAISYWENGKTFPDELNIKQLAEYFNTSTDYILGVSDTRNHYTASGETNKEEPITIAAHHEGDEYTDEELSEIENFKEFVKARRKK